MKDIRIKSDRLEDYGDVLKPEDIMYIVKIGRNEVYKKLNAGEIRSLKVAGKYRIPKQYLIDYLYPDQKKDSDHSDDSDQKKGA